MGVGGHFWDLLKPHCSKPPFAPHILPHHCSFCSEKGDAYTLVFRHYQNKAEAFLYSCLRKGNKNVHVTPGDLIFQQRLNNMQFVTTASFVATVYSDYLTSSQRSVNCPPAPFGPPIYSASNFGPVRPSDLW